MLFQLAHVLSVISRNVRHQDNSLAEFGSSFGFFCFMFIIFQAKLLNIYHEKGRFQDAIQLGNELLRELKKVDDKALVVDVQLIESKTYFALSNTSKSRYVVTVFPS